jgi:hypothetical protein
LHRYSLSSTSYHSFIYNLFLLDIDECATQTANCPANSQCVNTIGSFNCICLSGFTSSNGQCVGNLTLTLLFKKNLIFFPPSLLLDVNECQQGTDNCDANAQCANTPGNFTCICNSGYGGNGVTCTGPLSLPSLLLTSILSRFIRVLMLFL